MVKVVQPRESGVPCVGAARMRRLRWNKQKFRCRLLLGVGLDDLFGSVR